MSDIDDDARSHQPRSRTGIEREGMAEVDKRAARAEWVFRAQPIADVGIDAYIEKIGDAGAPDGRLVAVQVKAGDSQFDRETEDGWIFYVEEKHRAYWSRHSLPVVLVLYNPNTEVAYWQTIEQSTVLQTARGAWRVEVPQRQVLNEAAFDRFEAYAETGLPAGGADRVRALRDRKFDSDLGWIEAAEHGPGVFLEVDEVVGPSSDQGELRLVLERRGEKPESYQWPWVAATGITAEDDFRSLFPWADLANDDEMYRQAGHFEFLSEHARWNEADGQYEFDDEVDDLGAFDDWMATHWPRERIRHYAESADESVRHWRLRLTLNAAGRQALDAYHREMMEEAEADFRLEKFEEDFRSSGSYVGTVEESGYPHRVHDLIVFKDEEGLGEYLTDDWSEAGRVILEHALQRPPWRAQVVAFDERFGRQINESETGVWSISMHEVREWLDAVSAPPVWRRLDR